MKTIKLVIMLYHEICKEGGKILFLMFSCFYQAQSLTIENKNDSPVEIKYLEKKLEIGVDQKKIINETGLKSISIVNKKDQKITRNVFLFLNPQESLNIHIINDTIKFKGDKDRLHDYVYRGYFNYLTLKIGEYQNYYQKNDPNGFIRTSEMYLGDVLTKVEKLNNSPKGREDIHFKEIEKMAKERWFFTVFASFNSAKLGYTEKDMMMHYFNKYFKKDIEKYSCNDWVDYDIIRRYALHQKALGLKLPKYEIVEHSDDDDLNQYMPAKCQQEYFKGSYSFWVGKKDLVRADKYRKILEEKFHAKL